MSEDARDDEQRSGPGQARPLAQGDLDLHRLGLVVHPRRDLDAPLAAAGEWASAHGAELGQVVIPGQERRVAEPADPADCDLLIALGGDGTTLMALHTGAACGRPVLGVACGSVGALTSVPAGQIGWALDELDSGRWTPAAVPALEVDFEGGPTRPAINDVVVVRDGPGQVIVAVDVDGIDYAAVAGDGLVVATALGSSAYSMAAGGPLLAPGAEGMVVTPLADHGGACPPLVTGAASKLFLEVEAGYGGVRYELDGHRVPTESNRLGVRHRPAYATLVSLAGEEARLTGLRRRRLIVDGPRAALREARRAQA